MKSEKIIKLGSYVLMIVVLLLAAYIMMKGYRVGAFNNSEALVLYIKQYGGLAPLVFIVFQIVQVIIPIIPSFLGYAGGTAMFGTWGGFFYNYIGIALGSLLAFYLARKWGTTFVKSIIKKDAYDKCTKWMEKRKSFSIALFGAILLPLAPDDVLCYLSGLTKMPFAKFACIIALGKPWCILAYCIGFGQLF